MAYNPYVFAAALLVIALIFLIAIAGTLLYLKFCERAHRSDTYGHTSQFREDYEKKH